MAGYWPSSDFFAFLWNETKSRSIKTQKKKRGHYSAILTELAWSIKDLSYGIRSHWKKWSSYSILPTSRVANQRGICFILPAHGACHIIKDVIFRVSFPQLEIRLKPNKHFFFQTVTISILFYSVLISFPWYYLLNYVFGFCVLLCSFYLLYNTPVVYSRSSLTLCLLLSTCLLFVLVT